MLNAAEALPTSITTRRAPSRFSGRVCMVALLAGLTFIASGCATVANGTPEEIVAQRADQRWKLMMADQFDKSYEFAAPSYRAVTDAKAYRSRYGAAGFWTAARVAKVTCATEAACTAVLEITVKNISPMKSAPTLTTAVDEAWVKEDGKWYVLPAL